MSRWRTFVSALACASALVVEARAQSRKPGDPPPPADPRPAVRTRKPGEPPLPPEATDEASPAVGLALPGEGDAASLPITNSLTVGAAELFTPAVKLMFERGLDQRLSVGAIGTVGRVKVLDPLTGDPSTAGLYSVGALGRYYFSGGYLGGFWASGELSYTFLDSDQLVELTIVNSAAGLQAGALVGFKILTDIGFTFDLGGGARVLLYKPTPSVVTISPDANKPAGVLLALQAQIGWSF